MGMVVRTNTMALNAYRQLGMNNSAVAKSLEKLSSGFRINRAGDDAAGLAISEKMKAQITGLETASANAQDGISLIQTAEGNLNEVHDMLNRMVELATKSANGTYTSTERSALQDEVNQLLDEINRISESANFNGAKLLDGSLDGVGKEIVKDATFLGKSPVTTNAVDGSGAPGQLHVNASGSAKTSFEINLDHAAYKYDGDSSKAGQPIGGLVFAFNETGADDAIYNKLVDKDGNAIDYSVTRNASGGVDAGAIAKGIYENIAEKDGKKVVYVLAGDVADGIKQGDTTNTSVNMNDKKAQLIEYEVTLKGDKLTFNMTDEGLATAKAYDAANKPAVSADSKASAFRGNFSYYAVDTHDNTGNELADEAKAFADAVGLSQGAASSVINTGSANAGMQYAEATVNFTATEIKDGAGIRVGDEYYVWGATDKTVNTNFGDNVKVIDIRGLADDAGALKAENLNTALSALTKAAGGNKMFNVQHTNLKDWVTFTERSDNPSDADLTTAEGLMAQFEKFSGVNANVEKIGGNGKALTLQIGDTADSFNKMTVNIADMSAKGLNISGLDITSEEKASDAINKIKNAINSVSTARAGMGALQNRLEHTINNLDVAVENLSAANSRIRDTDMAKEMMNYTKMNVLVQSAQAMLAQANQQPQSVLQLLQ